MELNDLIIYVGLLQFLAGFIDGVNQAYLFHYSSKFGKIKPNEEAWRNKWKNGDPLQGEKFWGSSRWFVFVTDFYHLTRFASSRLHEVTALIYAVGFSSLSFWVVADFSITFVIRSIGFFLSYEIIFKIKKV